MEHTPTPWELAEHKPGDKWLSIHAASVEIDIDDWDEDGMQEQFANARFIVQAVNSHDGLEKTRLILEGLTPGGSEYYGDPERCAFYVRELITRGHEAKKDRVRLQRVNDELVAALERIAKQDCEYTDSVGCNLLPEGVVRSVCNPCFAQAILNKTKVEL